MLHAASPLDCSATITMPAYLHALQQWVCEGSEVCQCSDADHQDHQHDGQLEVGVEGSGQDLGGCQQQGEVEHHAVPKAELRPASKHCLRYCMWYRRMSHIGSSHTVGRLSSPRSKPVFPADLSAYCGSGFTICSSGMWSGACICACM